MYNFFTNLSSKFTLLTEGIGHLPCFCYIVVTFFQNFGCIYFLNILACAY